MRAKAADQDQDRTLDRVRELCAWVAAQSFRETIRTAELPDDLRSGVPELVDRKKINLQFLRRRVEHAELQLTPMLVGRKRRISDRARALSSAIKAQASRSRALLGMPSPAVIRGVLRPPEDLSEGAYWLLDAPNEPFFEERLEKAALTERAKIVREKIWSALVAQAGADPRSTPISWSQVVFPEQYARQRETLRGTRYVEREFYFGTGLDAELVTGRLLIPEKHRERKGPAVLYNHLHGNWHGLGTNELHQCWNFDGTGTLGDKLIDGGFIVMATDARGFGRRRAERADGSGPRDEYQTHDDLEDEKRDYFALAETGRSRYAKRSYEDYLTLRLLQQHPLVDANRISAIGMSTGCVRTWTLAALANGELARAVPLGTWPRCQELLETNKHGCHRDGDSFRGALTELALDTESFVLAGMNTHVLAFMGDQDPSSPGWKKVFEYGTWAARTLKTANFETVTMHGAGHTWTPESQALALEFLNAR